MRFCAVILFIFTSAAVAKPTLKIVECPGREYQCSGVDWKSEYYDSVVFFLNDPDGDPHPSLSDISVNGASVDNISLYKKTITCGKEIGSQTWSLKKSGKYYKFLYDSKCGGTQHSFEAFCQSFHRICTDAKP